jgi:hypothetical protein
MDATKATFGRTFGLLKDFCGRLKMYVIELGRVEFGPSLAPRVYI